jgi:hypothetical protein
MPANIAWTEATGYQAVYVGQPAWHGLGKVVDDAMTPEEALAAAGTGYTVEAAPLFAIINDEAVEVEDRVANYRTDTGAILGIVSTEYPILQNITPMKLLMELARTEQAGIVSHFALGKGERLAAVLDLKRLTDLRVPGDPSRIDAYRAFQAVTEYADHVRPLRVSERELVPARRFTSAVDGPAARMKADSLRLLREEFEVR